MYVNWSIGYILFQKSLVFWALDKFIDSQLNKMGIRLPIEEQEP